MKIGVMGSKSLGRRVLETLRKRDPTAPAITIDDTQDPRSELAFFRQASATIVHNRAEANEAISHMDVDLIVVAGWYWIIPLRENRFLGIHHSLLPKYRGGSPLVWALINGETEVGTSLFTLTDEVDAGPLWAQVPVPVGDGYIAEVMARCDAAALEALQRILDSGTQPREQEGSPTWCSPRSPTDGLIDWSRPAVEVQRWIRAQSRPYPGAFTYCGSAKVAVWKATATNTTHEGPAGMVEGDAVVCGDHHLLVIEEASQPLGGTLLSEPA